MPNRPYQDEAVRDTIANIRHRRIMRNLIVLPTGAGKTVIATSLAREALKWGFKVLFIVHRNELVWQAEEKFKKCIPGARVGVEKAGLRVNPDDYDIVVASIQSLSRNARALKFDPMEWVPMVDEGHHAASNLWEGVLSAFPASSPLIGFTATPIRGDGKGLDKIFDDISYQKGMRDLMEDGVRLSNGQHYSYITDFIGYRVQTEADISKVHKSSGDLDIQELAEKINTPERNDLVVRKYKELGEGFPGIAFTVNIQHSEDLAEMFTKRGISAHAISSKTPNKIRRDLIAGYKAGAFPILVSCDALTEGFDAERATVGLGTRPTTSPVVFQQQVGRVARPYPSPEDYQEMLSLGLKPEFVKPHAIWIDFCDQAGKHNLCRLPTLFGLNKNFDLKGKSAKEVARRVEQVEENYPGLDVEEATSEEAVYYSLRAHTERIQLFSAPVAAAEVREYSGLAWVKGGGEKYHISSKARKSMITVSKNLIGKWDVYVSRMGERNHIGSYSDLQFAIEVADTFIPEEEQQKFSVGSKWESDPCSLKQVNYLWGLSRAVRDGFEDPNKLLRHYRKLHREGDPRFSKGGLRDAIEVAKRLRH